MNTDWYVYDAVDYHITTGISSTTLCLQAHSLTGNYSLQGGNLQANWYEYKKGDITMNLNNPEATQQALNLLRSGDTFQW